MSYRNVSIATPNQSLGAAAKRLLAVMASENAAIAIMIAAVILELYGIITDNYELVAACLIIALPPIVKEAAIQKKGGRK